jgi:superfamily II DNA or RNA helicase
MLQYKLEFREKALLIHISEEGSKRILYLDTLKGLAKEADRDALSFLTKIHLRSSNASRHTDTLSFQQIEVSAAQSNEALRLLAKTGRLFYQGKPLRYDPLSAIKIYWKGEKHSEKACTLAAFLQCKEEEIPLASCEQIFPGTPFFFLKNGLLQPLSTDIPWKWLELFLKGPLLLEGMQKKKFLEESPPILWKERPPEKPLEVFPRLQLRDATGSFADLWMDYSDGRRVAFEDPLEGKLRLKEIEANWEKDLLESGFIRKQVGHSHYYCSGEKVRATLQFLLELGWSISDFKNRKVYLQTDFQIAVNEEKGAIAVRGTVHFQTQRSSLKKAMQALSFGRLWVELEGGGIGLLDRKALQKIEGEWEEETLYLNKAQIGMLGPLLDVPQVQWEESLKKAAEGLRGHDSIELAPPDASFCGQLLPYQQKGVDWLAFLSRWGFSGMLADEMGLGKTVQVLAFFSRLRTNLPILIVAPTSLLYNWKAEIFRFLRIDPYLHTGSGRLTQVVELCKLPWILTSYALLRLDEELFSQIECEVIVLDESNAIKTAGTQTAQAACRLKAKMRIAMTGTPIENRPEELWSQFRFLMPPLFGERAAFQATPPESIKRKLRPFILRRRKEEVQLELPEKIEQTTWVEMEGEQAQVYESYREGLRTGLLKKIEKVGIGVCRMEVLEAILRLRQICCDPRLLSEAAAGAKMQQLMTDVEEALSQNRKILIYSQFTQMLQLIRKELRAKGWDPLYLDGSLSAEERGDLVREFQEGTEKPLFLLSLKAGGVGLNLTAADYVLLFDPWWNEAVERQAIDRAHRIGQKKTVIAKRYLTPGTIEEKILELKVQKQTASDQLLDLEGESTGWTEADLLSLLT